MIFSLVVCTYMRPEPLLELLKSVSKQSLYPDEILIIDGSLNDETDILLQKKNFANLKYFLVSNENRGLTRQRNFGISKVNPNSEFISFVDDDTVLEYDYFAKIVETFQNNPDVTAVGGIAVNENRWQQKQLQTVYNQKKYYSFEEHVYKEGLRNVVRNYLGLASNLGPGKMPYFSHGRTCGFPLNNKTYEVDLLIGMSMAFRKNVYQNIQFSKFFEGYGLYEDADYSLRALQFGKNVINTQVKLNHFHAPSGRPNHYKYGKMVVRNGWYVWRIKNEKPVVKDRFKWNAIVILLAFIRLTNILTEKNKKAAFDESLGRIIGWWILLFNKPKMQ
ncbi:glycosyltransferase family 2 protein [Flavobacterium sp. F52]|uniref:glycosyltransferase family 2 protein n=1 Tax=Flavobacterium TaxID=237 RepID=UPI000272FE0B|nr:glycosyltransferase family 2 protein [Flavobacterium sp. F52]EJG01917.1 glycosyl transferase family protein [Flavobacterium sp. F52]